MVSKPIQLKPPSSSATDGLKVGAGVGADVGADVGTGVGADEGLRVARTVVVPDTPDTEVKVDVPPLEVASAADSILLMRLELLASTDVKVESTVASRSSASAKFDSDMDTTTCGGGGGW